MTLLDKSNKFSLAMLVDKVTSSTRLVFNKNSSQAVSDGVHEWLGDLMLQVQWAMVRVRLGAGEESMVGRMERMSRRLLSQPKLTGLCAGVSGQYCTGQTQPVNIVK